MNSSLSIRLDTSTEQNARLLQLQALFAEVCNALAPLVQRTRCWNRVALHHLAYRSMREQFPALGSQMICNALYSVSRVSRLVYQHPQSPFSVARLAGQPLPRLRFLPESPVYFDRHTLSLKQGQASMYTLDGRMRFNLPLAPEDEHRFRTAKLREIVLRRRDSSFELSFGFGDGESPADATDEAQALAGLSELPQYLLVVRDPAAEVESALAAAVPFQTTMPHPKVRKTA